MVRCINLQSPEVAELAKILKNSKVITATKLAVWQKAVEDTSAIPTATQLDYIKSPSKANVVLGTSYKPEISNTQLKTLVKIVDSLNLKMNKQGVKKRYRVETRIGTNPNAYAWVLLEFDNSIKLDRRIEKAEEQGRYGEAQRLEFMRESDPQLGLFTDDIDVNEFPKMPMKFSSVEKLKNNEKTISVRPVEHKSGTYRFGDELFNVDNLGLVDYEIALKILDITADEFTKQFIGSEEVKYEHIKNWKDGKGVMYVYSINKIDSTEDQMTETLENKFDRERLRLSRLIKTISNKIKRTKDEGVKETLKIQKNRLQDQLKQLESAENQSLVNVITQAQDHLNQVDVILRNPSPENIKLAYDYIIGYPDLLQSFEYIDDAEAQKVASLINNINKKILKIDDVATNLVGKIIHDRSSGRYTASSVKESLFDDSMATATIYDASKSKNKLVKVLDLALKEAEIRIKDAYYQYSNQIEPIIDELKSYQKSVGLKGDMVFDYMLQYEDGKRNGNTVGQYTADYYTTKKNLAKESTYKLAKWLGNNHTYTVNQEAWENFKKEKREWANSIQPDAMKAEYLGDMIIAQANPETYIKILQKAKTSKISEAEANFVREYNKNHRKRYKGQDILVEKVDDKWKDSKYTEIMNLDDTDPRKRFYLYYNEKIKQQRESVGEYIDRFLPYSYIPELEPLSPFYKNLPDKFLNSISQRIRSSKVEELDPVTGEPIMTVPLFSLSRSLNADEKSYELDKVLDNFMMDTLNKTYKEEIEDEANVMLQVLANRDYFVTDNAGNVVTYEGNPQTKKIQNSNSYQIAKYTTMAKLYGISQDIEGVTNIKTLNKKDAQELTELESLEEKIPEDLQRIAELKSRQQNITGTKVANSIIKFTLYKALAFNPISGITEMIQGLSSNFIESASGKFFNESNYWRAVGLMIHSRKPGLERSRIGKILDAFDVVGEIDPGFKHGDSSAFWMLKQADKFSKGVSLFAYLDNQKIKDKQGNEYNLLDYITVDNNNNLSITDLENFDNPFYDENNNPTKYKIDTQLKINEIVKSILARNNSTDPIQMNKKWYFRMIGQFRMSWMFEGFNRRFGEQKDNLILEADTKGYYRSTWEQFWNKEGNFSFNDGMKAMWSVLTKQDTELSELDKTNIKKFLREISLILSTYTLWMIFSGVEDDDEEDGVFFNKTANFLINQSYRVNRDLTFFISPSSAIEVTSNIAPALKTSADAMRIIDAMVKTATGNPYVYEGTKREELRVPRAIEKFTPIVNQPRRLYSWMTEDVFK